MGIPRKLQERLDSFALFPDRADRIELLIGIADQFQPVPETIARRPFSEEHRVKGCESEAYVFSEVRPDNLLDFHFAVENRQGLSAMALGKILKDSCSGAPLQEIEEIPSDLIYRIFGEELSMGKNMGLGEMVAMVRRAAKDRREQARGGQS